MRNFLPLLALLALPLQAQQSEQKEPFNGIITDLAGTPIKRARVYVSRPDHYARTDRQGRFGLTDVQPTDTLHIVYRREHYLIPVEGRKSLRIHLGDQLNPVADEDQELTDLGYGFVRRREFTGVSNGISGEELVRTGRSSILEALQGRVPGLSIGPSRPGQEPAVNIRGINSINLPLTPIYVVDGVIVETLEFVDVYSVDHVEILKDASIYGAQGANGAILVTTKRGL